MFQIYKNTNQDLLLKQVKPLFEATNSGGFANIFAVWLVYGLVVGTHHQADALLLGIVVSVLSVIRIIISNEFLRAKDKKINLYLGGYLFITLVIGIAWGLFALMQISQSDEAIRNMVYLINFGMIAGSIATLSVWVPAYIAYVAPQAISIITVLAVQGTQISLYMAAAFFVFITIMISTSIKVNRSHKQRLVLNIKNHELIENLHNEVAHRTRTQVLLEHSKRNLKEKVKERTLELENINDNLKKEILEKENAKKKLGHIAYHDELTNLPNKNFLIKNISKSIAAANELEHKLGILFIDLDRFKAINDSLGHNIGDKLIQEVAKRLQNTLRNEDTISRNGGDEFVIVIQRMLNNDKTIHIAKKLIESMTNIFEIDGHKIHIGASIGISIYPNDGHTAIELIRNADTAMFSAKKIGGNRHQFYDASMSNRLRERLDLENELHTALERNEFFMVYQPQVNCLTGKTVGFESLLRWQNKSKGLVPPDQFVPLLEETGLIYKVGRWVIREVIKFIRSGGIGDRTVSVNLSALQCGDILLVDFIKNEVKKSAIDATHMGFEITESLLINDFEKTQTFLKELNHLGCSIALDDFGTGYTSMSYLTRLPIDCIKVDQSFVRGIEDNDTLKNIVKAIVNMSASLGIKNIFEGIETETELQVIKKLNGEIIQGYLYSKALETKDINKWLGRSNSNISHLRRKQSN